MIERSSASRMSDLQEAQSYGVDLFGIEFEKIARVIDENCALQWLLGERVIADAVVGEVVEDFQREEVAGSGDVGVPSKDGAIDYLDMVGVAAG